ncbi:sensor domain-containing protein [Lysobacter claricitrinus]|uniref:sensor domain-containing protein n=1 Tax=Lysobacter claricitrinus TaxID=3367728 RepID=UPI0037DB9EAE
MNAAHSFSDLRAPATIAEYLERLRTALAGADPALIQDALYDAEDYLRSEMSANPGRSEAEVIAEVAGSYGAPNEVADIYRDTEVRVQTALQSPKPRKPRTTLGRFFGVALEPRTYAALFYMLLSLATGIFYFTWVVTGLSMTAGMSILIIGIPLGILFFGSVRVLSLVEGRLVEVMLGERMPRRPRYVAKDAPLLDRVRAMFTDPRTWSTMAYMLLMLPIGIVYFTLAVTLLSISAGFIAAPVMALFAWAGWAPFNEFQVNGIDAWGLPLVFVGGVVLLFATLHLARGVGHLHGQIAKAMLVASPGSATA